MNISVINYGAGNLSSVARALDYLGFSGKITSHPEDINNSDILFLPGVGTAGDIIASLTRMQLLEPLVHYIRNNRPYFGICLGLQILFSYSEESGGQKCLDIIKGRVAKLTGNLKVPHIGWNTVSLKSRNILFDGIPDNSNFYFVHSYYGNPEDSSVVAGETTYGTTFTSVVSRGNLLATQFHPEKSGEQGLRLINNFLKIYSKS